MTTRPRLAALALAGVVGMGGAGALQAPVRADPLADARGRAAALRVELADLQARAELATERYDESYAQLGRAVTAHIAAQRAVDQARQGAAARDQVTVRRVRALYMAGGPAALYAHVLDSASPAEMASRVTQVKVVLAADDAAGARAQQSVSDATAAAADLAASEALATRLQRAVADRAATVTGLLARTDALVAGADAQVRALAAAQQATADRAAAARARTALAGAGTLGLVDAAPTPQASAALAFARQQLGKPYVWGAVGPDSFDCSGLTGAAYRAAGVLLPRTASEQWHVGSHVELSALAPGDLLFWAFDPSNPGTIHHVALYLGGGMMLAAPKTGDVVKVEPMYLDGYAGAVRPVPAVAPRPAVGVSQG